MIEALGLGVALLALVALNALYTLCEFAIVRVRPSRVAELVAQKARGAATLALVQRNLDEHLGVCQVGITLASIALGIVGQRVAERLGGGGEHAALRYAIAIAASYALVSGAHVVLGEMVPKAVAIRTADRVAVRVAPFLRASRALFWPALWVFNVMAALVSRAIRLPRETDQERHTEQELRIILEHFQERGNLSFKRLLFMENVFDFGSLQVRQIMRPRSEVRRLRADAPWDDNLEVIRGGRFTRYPLIGADPDHPAGIVHVKDLVLGAQERGPDLEAIARAPMKTRDSATLEELLADMQRRHQHAALVYDAEGTWCGFVTLEDVVEEIVGTIRDEFEDEEPVRLADALAVERVQLGVEAASPEAAVRAALSRIPREKLPFPGEWIALAVEDRERTAGTYMGEGIAIPHARLAGLEAPFAMVLRSVEGIPCAGTTERAHVLFVLLTPAEQPRVHQRLLQIIALLLHESGYVRERIRSASTAADLLEAIRAGEQASLDRPSQSKLPPA